VAETYRKIRNTFRYLLGNLSDFDPARDALPLDQLLPVRGQYGWALWQAAGPCINRGYLAGPLERLQLDRYALDVVAGYVERARSAYDAMAFNKVYADTIGLVTTRLSATYFDIIKDRLYADARAGPRRRSAQTVLYHVRCRAERRVHWNRS